MNHFYSNLKLMLVALFAFMGVSVWADDVTDVLNQALTGVSGTSYTDFSDKTSQSSAVYAGQCAGGNESIQLRSNNNNSGVVTTTSGGTVKKIVVTWNSNTAAARTLNIYGSNTAYTAATDLYSTDNQGTLIGTLKCEDATEGVSTLEVSDSYTFIGFRSASGAMYLTSVAITWSTGSSAPVIAKPTLPASTTFIGSMEVAITAGDGLEIHYTTDGTDPTTASPVYSNPLTITETTTVKAIAVEVTGASSGVASATYTLVTPITIAEAQAADKGTTVCIEGTVVASAANGAVVYDGTDYLYYYNNANALTIGQKVRMVGALSNYGGANQLTNSTTVTELGTEEVTHPTAVALDGAAFDAIQAAKVVSPRQFVTFIGTLGLSGNYVNVTIAGAEAAVGSIVKPHEDLSELDGKQVLVNGYLMYVNGKYVYAVATSIEALKTELANAAFEDSDESNAIGVRTYAKDIKAEEVAQMQPVTGWDIVENGDARAAGVFAYGSAAFLGGEGYLAPAASFDADAKKALGVVSVWSASLQYTQQVYLEAGTYLLQAPVFNVGGTGSIAKNLIGIDDTYATSTSYPVNAWTVENVELTLTEAKMVTVSVGYAATNNGSAAMPHLFVEGVKLVSGTDAIEAAKAAAEERVAVLNALAKAQPIVDAAVVGDGLFCYPAAAVDAAKNALAAATTVDAVNEVLTTLEAAQVLPEADKKYSLQLKDGGNYMTIDGGIKLAAEPVGFSFVAVDGGYAIANGTDYVALAGTNAWSMAVATEPYAWTFAPLADGFYSIAKASAPNEHIGLDNTEAGSSCYADKAVSDKALWAIVEFTEPQPQNDYTSYIVNADLTGEGGFDATGTKGIDGSGIVKAGNNAQFDFKQTIENLPAGKYKLTAKAAYRYSGSEADEAAAIAAGTPTKLANLYATVGSKTTSQPVQNRYDGASDTNYYTENDGVATVDGKFVPNSSSAVKAWFDAGQYINEVEFNLPEDGNVTIGIVKTAQPEAGDYTVIGPWTLERIGDAEVENFTPGDADGDGSIDVVDHAVIRNYILDNEQPAYVKKYDANGDQSIDVGDLTAVVNLILYGTVEGPSSDTGVRGEASADVLTLNYVSAGRYALNLRSGRAYNAFQMDLDIPEGMTLVSEESAGHEMMTRRLANGKTRVLVFSMNNATFEGSELLFLNVAGQGTLKAENIIFSDLNANAVCMILGDATGINGLGQDARINDAYDLSGRKVEKLQRGVYIVNGKKVAVK